MAARLVETPFVETLARRLHASVGSDATLYWLGQAGFLIEIAGLRVVIDPYLSDTLATKYASSRFSHERMSPPPIMPEELGPIDLVLCTHHHTDHMDPGTLAPLARLWPRLLFVVPAASAALARERIQIDDARLIAMDAGQSVRPLPGLLARATRAAHETIERDDLGRCRFLGYALSASGVTIFHSGDCAPFEGQREEIRRAGSGPSSFAGEWTLASPDERRVRRQFQHRGSACALPELFHSQYDRASLRHVRFQYRRACRDRPCAHECLGRREAGADADSLLAEPGLA